MRRGAHWWPGHTLLLGAAVAFASACQEELPAAPDELTAGTVVYEHASFAGDSAHLTGDVDFGFHEDWLDVTADVPDLGQVRGYCHNDTWNDCISSIRVRRQ